MRTVILTGCSGFLGSNILLDLLETDDRPSAIHCLVRGQKQASGSERALAALNLARRSRELPALDALPPQVRIINKDLKAVTAQDFQDVPDHSILIHSAALLSFAPEDRLDIQETNIEGLQRLLDCFPGTQLQRLVFVSTAFNCGTSEGEILEELHATDAEFNNDYEQSKAIGEHLVKQWGEARRIDVSIVRPSIIMGHSTTYHPGSSNDSYYGLLTRLAKLATLARPDQLPVRFDCLPDTLLDLVPVDCVSNTILQEARSAQRGFMITHAVSGCLSRVGDLFGVINDCLGCEVVQPGRFDLTELQDIELLVHHSAAIYKPYMRQTKSFMKRPGSDVVDVSKMVEPWTRRFLEVRALTRTSG